jgi:DNA-binding XRE family transcriptional regulator
MSACPAPGQQSDTSVLPPYLRQFSTVSARFTPTPDGQPTIHPADSGPNTTRTYLPHTLLTWYEHPTTSNRPRVVSTPALTPTFPAPAAPLRRPTPQQAATPAVPAKPALGVIIRRYRRRAGLSQVVCAQLVGRSESWLSQLERGDRSCTNIEVLSEFARVLHLDLNKLIEVAR